MEAPTGNTHEKTRAGERFETEHQPGSGSWDPLLGFALSKGYGRISLDASLLYAIGTKGAQDTDLGDRAFYNLALSYRLGGEAAHRHEDAHDGHEHRHRDAAPASAPGSGFAWDLVLELNGEWQDRQRIRGVEERDTGGNQVYLSPGLRLLAGGLSAHVAVGIPVVNDVRRSHPDTGYRIVAGISKAFATGR